VKNKGLRIDLVLIMVMQSNKLKKVFYVKFISYDYKRKPINISINKYSWRKQTIYKAFRIPEGRLPLNVLLQA
jgi:hypothetical protein